MRVHGDTRTSGGFTCRGRASASRAATKPRTPAVPRPLDRRATHGRRACPWCGRFKRTAFLFLPSEESGQPSSHRVGLNHDGTVAANNALELGEGARDLAVAVVGDELGLAWISGPNGARFIQLAGLSKEGAAEVVPTHVATEGASRPTSTRSTGSDWTVFHGTTVDEAVFKVWMLEPDATGVPISSSREPSNGSTTAVFPRATWDGELLAVAWHEDTTGDVMFALVGLDEDTRSSRPWRSGSKAVSCRTLSGSAIDT